jgi:anaerobic selenocysteine-containing dehydrogenase
MGFDEPWLRQDTDAVIDEVLAATAARNPRLAGITLARLKQAGQIPLTLDEDVPFAGGRFPTPSGKVELYSSILAADGYDPLPGYTGDFDDGEPERLPDTVRFRPEDALSLITPAAHHFVSSSLANGPSQLRGEGTPFIEIHPDDAAARGIRHGDRVAVENGRGCVALRAVVTDGVRPGVVASPKGRWSKLADGGRNVNWTTSDALGDFAGQSTFHSNQVWLRPAAEEGKESADFADFAD